MDLTNKKNGGLERMKGIFGGMFDFARDEKLDAFESAADSNFLMK